MRDFAKKPAFVLAVLLAGVAFTASASPANAKDMHAKIDMAQARHLALTTYPGKIVKEELEKEKGGSGLRYSFDIKSTAGTHEVGVDAADGHILENSVEGADAD